MSFLGVYEPELFHIFILNISVGIIGKQYDFFDVVPELF